MIRLHGRAARIAAAVATGFALASCTQPTPMSPRAQASLGAAGFRPASLGPDTAGGFVTDGEFSCPAERCGENVFVAIGSMNVVSEMRARGLAWPQGVTFEQAARTLPNGRQLIQSGLDAGVRRLSGRHPGVHVSPLTLDRSGTTARGTMTVTRGGKPFYVSMVIALQGDVGRVLGSMSRSRAVAARYARAEWLR
jgi:hypothetical protein